MLSDRSYMRDATPGGRTSVLTWILCGTAAVFILQNVVHRLLMMNGLLEAFAGLSIGALRAGHVWTLVTYGFLFPYANILEVLVVGLTVYFLGRDILPVLGSRRFVGFYLGSLALGALFWAAVNWHNGGLAAGGVLMGAEPAVTGMLALFALLYPNRDITILFLFIPVTVKPKYIALALLAIDLFLCAFYEVLGAAAPISVAPSAQLGGMAAGWLYFELVQQRGWGRSRRPAVELPRWMKRTGAAAEAPAAFHVNLGSREHLKAEVDRILDKINSQGFGALTPDEKRLLDEARDLLSRR